MVAMKTYLVLCGIVLWKVALVDSVNCDITAYKTLQDAPKKTVPFNVTFGQSFTPKEDVCPLRNLCFNISGSNMIGSVTKGDVLDLDNEASHDKTVNVMCNDTNGLIKTCCIMLIFQYSNTYPPTFQPASNTIQVNESKAVGSKLFNISSIIRDKDKWLMAAIYKYQITIQPSSGHDTFTCDDKGVITLNKKLDYDHGVRKYKIDINVTDCGNQDSCSQAYNAATHLTIDVLNVNDERVKFKEKFYVSRLKDDTPKMRIINIFPQPDVTDLEVNSNAKVLYRLLDGSPKSFTDYFQFDTTLRNLRLIKPLKKNFFNNFTATLRAYKTSREEESYDDSYLIVNILRGNNYKPRIIKTPSAANITEILPVGSPVLLVQALDKDKDELIYTMTDISSMFIINNKSGLVTLGKDIQGNLGKFPVTLAVIAEEEQTDNKSKSQAHQIVVRLKDVNIHNPKFTNLPYTFDVLLQTAPGTSIGKVTVSDEDQGNNGNVTLTIGDTKLPFKIDQRGILTVSAALHTNLYSFTVTGQDGATYPRSSVAMVTVNVTSPNRKPTFSKSMSKAISVPETAVPGTILMILQATDPDDDKLTFTAKSTGDYFQTKPSSSDKSCFVLTLMRWLNESAPNNISVNLTVSDTVDVDTTTVNVNKIKVNSYVPIFVKTKYIFSVKEDKPNDTDVGTVKATDQDGDAIEYRLPDSQYFTVESMSGVIKTKQKFDQPLTYSFAVQAFDSNKNDGVALVIINVTDINNNPPKFQEKLFNTTITENNMCTDPIYKPVATDEDIYPENQDNIFKTSHKHFEIKNNDLYMRKGSCSDESLLEKHVKVDIEVSDRNKPSFHDTMTVDIYFKDINNHIPKFASVSNKLLVVDENTPVGLSLYRFTTVDQDISYINRLTKFSMRDQNPNEDKIRVDPITGVLYLNKPLDYDRPNDDRNITFKVFAENMVTNVGLASTGSNASVVEFTVVTKDVDDIPLQFHNTTYIVSVKENAQVSSLVLTVSATNALKYSIDNKVPFTMEPLTGKMKLKSSLDYNKVNTYVFPVKARNNKENKTAMVVINVINVNDAPTIKGPLKFEMVENLPVKTMIGHIVATDPDNDTLQYMLNDPNFFMNSSTGDLYTNRFFDFEQNPTPNDLFSFNVVVSDGTVNDTKEVTVTVSNVNDMEPHFKNRKVLKEILDTDIKPNAFLATVKATNPDKLSPLTYKIFDDNRFVIDYLGKITVNRSYTAEQIKDRFISVLVIVHNIKYTNAAMLVLEVIKSPEFVESHYNLFVNRNITHGTDIFKLSPCLLGDPYFNISRATVTLSDTIVIYKSSCNCIVINNKLDQSKYNVTLTLTQNAHSTSTQLIIHVLSVNSDPPEILFPKDVVDVLDNVSPGYVISNVIAKDNDFTPGFTFYLTETYNKFHIDSINGNLTVVNSLDYLVTSLYNLTVFVQDRGSPPLNSHKLLIVKVINSNKFAPNFLPSLVTTKEVDENSNGDILSVTAKDDDPSDSITYEITNGNIDQAFEINRNTGLISVKNNKALNFEVTQTFKLNITATDSAKNPKSASIEITINLKDTNDNSPIFHSLTYFAKKLPIEPGENVFEVHASDMDTAENNNNVIKYAQLNYENLFKINEMTGVVTSKTNLTQPKTYFMVFQACDGGYLCNNQTVQLLTSSNVPIIVNVKENISDAFVVDISNISSRVDVTYYLKTCSNFFTINSKTGILRTTSPLRWNILQTNLTAIIVEDSPLNSTEITVTVIIEDINDHQPQFNQPLYQFDVVENSEATFIIQAKDVDSLLNANITYFVQQSTPIKNGDIVINAITGQLTITNLDREEMSNYKFHVTANDNGEPPITSTATVSITVLDQNDNKPVFQKPTSQTFDVLENYSPHHLVTSFKAIDTDSGANAQVFYKVLNTSLPFTIDPTTGDLYTTNSLDYETNPTYNVEVMAFDVGEPQQNSTNSITINVVDVCDDHFQLMPAFYVANNFPVDRTMYSLTSSTDPTNFSLKDDQNIFSLNSSSGELSILSRFPGQPSTYTVTVEAQNLCNVTVEEKFKIKLYDAPKQSSNSILKVTLPEEIINNQSLFNFSSLEEFQGDNVLFELQNFKGFFSIKDNQLLSEKSIDRESHPSFSLNINVVKSTRVKRSLSNNNIVTTLTIEVTIQDTNDNSPQFPSNSLYFGIPVTSLQFFEVAKIEAVDKDEGENSISLYSLIGKDREKFFIQPTTGALHSLFIPAAVTQKEYKVTVVAVDKADQTKSDTVDVFMSIYSPDFSMILTVNATVGIVRVNREELIRNMSEVLGLQIVVDHIQIHVDGKHNPDVKRSDILFHAINKDTGQLIPRKELEQKLKAKEREISSLLKRLKLNKDAIKHADNVPVSVKKPHKSSGDGGLIVIIILAVIVLLIAITTITVFVLITRRYKKKFDELQSLLFREPEENKGYEKEDTAMDNFERDSINSSGHVSGSSRETDLSAYAALPFSISQMKSRLTPSQKSEATPAHISLNVDQFLPESTTDDVPNKSEDTTDLPDCPGDVLNSSKTVTVLGEDKENTEEAGDVDDFSTSL